MMAAAQVPFLAAVLLLLSSGLYCSSDPSACPEPCTCQRAPLLNCSSSGLSSVPQYIPDCVTELDLSHNLLGLVTLRQPHRNLRSVWLGNNSITHVSLCIERSRYVRGRRLHGLPLRSRGCVSWAPTLQLLSVERNQLVQLPEGLNGSESLQVLQLSFNRISSLQPGVLSNLRQLKELHLQHNLITSLHPQMFLDLAQLKVLDLSFNMLTSLHPLTYLSLRTIGADVSLGGNRWQCDCNMRSLRRRIAYDSSKSLHSWSLVCASPALLSGRDLLQLEENDLNCFNTENTLELHQDVTVYSGSEILLSCSTQDSLWWTPNGKASVSHPHPGLLIRNITERETGLYVCVSEEQGVLSVFNLQLSETGRTRRISRSLPNPQIIGKDTLTGIDQARRQTTTQSHLTLAVCLSVFITFLIAFILGVLARPLFDILWGRITNKKSADKPDSVSSVEEGQYDNVAFNDDDPEERGPHRERRVTFSSVQYYDTIVSNVEQESIATDQVIECGSAEADEDKNTFEDSGSENALRQKRPEDTQKDGSDQTHHVEFEQIQDPVKQEETIRLSSHSDCSLSDKECKNDETNQGQYSTPKSLLPVEDSVQQTADFSTPRDVEVPPISIEALYSSEPFVDWFPHGTTTELTKPELWQENEEQFEFSDSVRSTSARSSNLSGSFNNSNQAPTLDKQKEGDMSSSSSYVSEDEATHYNVNPDQQEEEDLVLGFTKHNKSPNTGVRPPPSAYSSCSESESEITDLKLEHNDGTVNKAIVSQYPETQWPAVNLEHTLHIKRRLDIKAASPASDSSSSSDSENETTGHIKKQEQAVKVTQTVIHKPETQWPELNLEHIPHIKRHLDIKASLPPSDSSSSSGSENETPGHIEKQRQGKVNITGPPFQESQEKSHGPETQWPTLDLKQSTRIKRRLDMKTASPASDSSSSSDSDDETVNHMNKQEQAVKVTQIVSNKPETQWPELDLEHIPHIKRRLDIKAASPASDSSSSSDSENETTGHVEKQEQAVKVTQTVIHKPETQWPELNLEHIPHIKRRLDIKASLTPSELSSSSDSDEETTGHIEKQRPGKVNIAGPLFQESQEKSHDPETQWPSLDLEHIPHIKRHLDIKASLPPSDSSSSSDSENETANHMNRQEQTIKVTQTVIHKPETQWPTLNLEHIPHIERRLDIKASLPPSDSSSSSDSENETANHKNKQEQAVKVTQIVSNKPETQWPELDLEHIPHIKRRLDVKAPSPASDSSSSSDSENETTGHIEKQRQVKVNITGPPFQESQEKSHDPETQWPTLDLEQSTRIKRRLDMKTASPASDSSSSSDSDDETVNHMNKQEQAVKVTQIVSNKPETQWPELNLEHIPHIKRRLDVKAPSPASDSSSSSDSENETTGHIEKQKQGKVNITGFPFQESQEKSHDPETQWPSLDLKQSTRIKRRLDIKAASPASDSSSSSDSENEARYQTEKQRLGVGEFSGLRYQESQTVSHDPGTQWPAVDIDKSLHIKRHLDIKVLALSPDLLSQGSPQSETNSSTSDSDDENRDNKDKLRMRAIVVPKATKKELIGSPRPKTDNIQLEKYTVHTDDLCDKATSDHVSANQEQHSQWATMNLGFSRFRQRLDITPPTDKPPKLPPSSPPAPSSSSSSESGIESKSSVTKPKRGGVVMQGITCTDSSLTPEKISANISLTLTDHDHNSDNSVEVEDRLITDYRDYSTEGKDHSVPDLNLGVPHIKRRLNIKAPSPPPSNSPSSCSDNESEGKGSTATQTHSRHTSYMSGTTDDDSLINYRRLIIKSSLANDSSPSIDKAQTTDNTRESVDRNAPLAQRRVPNMSFDDMVKKKIKQLRHPKDVDMPPEIRWTGVGRHLSDLSIPTTRKHLDGSLISAQQVPPAKPQLSDSSNSSSSESDDSTQETGKADATPIPEYSPLPIPRSVSLSSKFVCSPSNTNEIWKSLSNDRAERKGLSALKAMSSERKRWETEHQENDMDTAPPCDDEGPQGDISSSHSKSEEYNKPLANISKVPLSTSINEGRVADLSYDIPQYRRHVIEAIDPIQRLPPPIPATPPPDQASDFTWRSSQNS